MEKKIGNYTYFENNLLGKGAFGTVYEGVNLITKQKVAIKQIRLQSIQNKE